MGVRAGARRAATAVVLVALLVSAWPMPALATHAQLDGPGDGTTVQGWTLAGFGNLTFVPPRERLVAYHEWRDVVATTIQRPGEETPWAHGPAYDLETGVYVGNHHEARHEIPMLGGALAELGLVLRSEHEGLTGYLGLDPLLPESLLWGRYLWPGDAWAVSALSWGPDPALVHVTVEEGQGDADLVVFVERRASGPSASVWEWRLGLDGGDRVVATERALRVEPVGTPRDESTWYEMPLVLVEPGGDPFRFGGLSHVALADEPDRLMSFGTVGVTPDDPSPHPMFDVGEAAVVGLASEHEAVRAFRAQAEDPYLVAATVSGIGLADPSMRWALRWLEAGGKALHVTFVAYKTPWTPLLATSFDAEVEASDERPLDAGERNRTVTVHPGSYARYFDAFAAERNRVVTGYDWSLHALSSSSVTSAGGELVRMQNMPHHDCGMWVTVDGATGVVVAAHDDGMSMMPGASCRHEFGYAALDPLGRPL